MAPNSVLTVALILFFLSICNSITNAEDGILARRKRNLGNMLGGDNDGGGLFHALKGVSGLAKGTGKAVTDLNGVNYLGKALMPLYPELQMIGGLVQGLGSGLFAGLTAGLPAAKVADMGARPVADKIPLGVVGLLAIDGVAGGTAGAAGGIGTGGTSGMALPTGMTGSSLGGILGGALAGILVALGGGPSLDGLLGGGLGGVSLGPLNYITNPILDFLGVNALAGGTNDLLGHVGDEGNTAGKDVENLVDGAGGR